MASHCETYPTFVVRFCSPGKRRTRELSRLTRVRFAYPGYEYRRFSMGFARRTPSYGAVLASRSTHTRWWSLPSAIAASGDADAGQNTPLPVNAKPVDGNT